MCLLNVSCCGVRGLTSSPLTEVSAPKEYPMCSEPSSRMSFTGRIPSAFLWQWSCDAGQGVAGPAQVILKYNTRGPCMQNLRERGKRSNIGPWVPRLLQKTRRLATDENGSHISVSVWCGVGSWGEGTQGYTGTVSRVAGVTRYILFFLHPLAN